MAATQNQYVPYGSYILSSKDVLVQIQAECDTGTGQTYNTSTLSYSSAKANEIADISNNWGKLSMTQGNGSLPNAVNKFGKYIPAGSYQNSSRKIRVTVTATCKARDGSYKSPTSITYDTDQASKATDIENINGVLMLKWQRTLTIRQIGCVLPSSGAPAGLASGEADVIAEFNRMFQAAQNERDGKNYYGQGRFTGRYTTMPQCDAVPLLLTTQQSAEDFKRRVAQASSATKWSYTGDDDVYIKINGNKVWPRDKDEHDMGKSDVTDVNINAAIDRDLTLSIMERDATLWLVSGGHDTLGEVTLRKDDIRLKSDLYFFYSLEERSAYLLDIIIS